MQTHITISNKPANILNEEVFNAHQDEADRQARIARAAPQLLEALEVMTSLCRLKYGNLDADVYAEIEKAEVAIASAK